MPNMRIKRRDCAVCTASSFSFRAYSLLCRPKTAEQIPERGGRVNPGLLKLESPSHPDAVEHQRQHQFRAGYRNAHIPVDLLLPKLTVLKLLLTGAVGILAGKLLPALSAVHLPPLGLLITFGWALISSIRSLCSAARSRIAFALSSFPDGRVRRFASSVSITSSNNVLISAICFFSFQKSELAP